MFTTGKKIGPGTVLLNAKVRKVHNKVRKVHKILNILQSAQSAQSAFQKSCGVSIHRVFVAEFKNMVHFRQSAFLQNDKVRKVHFY